MFDLGDALGDLEDQDFSICLDGLEFDPLTKTRDSVRELLAKYGCSQQCIGIAFRPSSVVPGGVALSMAFKISFKGLQSSAVLSFEDHYHPVSAPWGGEALTWSLKSPSGPLLGSGSELGAVLQNWLVGLRSEILSVYKNLGELLGVEEPAKAVPVKKPKKATAQKPKAKKPKKAT